VLLATGYWLLATGYWLLATGYWLLATGYEPGANTNPRFDSCRVRHFFSYEKLKNQSFDWFYFAYNLLRC
jgi:hypothetical protein